MSSHDFSQLSPHDFERLCRDLLQAEMKIRFESFSEGPDGGVDLRYARAGARTIVQCKRYVRSGYLGLLREMREEAGKVAKLAPDRYILMTAAALTPGNKAELSGLVGPRVLAEEDVFGREDINNLLGLHREVERAHYKLYLSSVGVLERVLHNDVVTQTGFAVERIRAEVRRYVQGSAYPRAREALDRDRIAVLSGHPGVGKTTLANLLLYEHVGLGFEPVVIRQDFSEGRRLFKPGALQVFHFDDFFGVTYLGDRGTLGQLNDHRAIVDFASMVAADESKRLVLTTREHLLVQARRFSENLRHSGVLDHRVLIRMGDYDRRQRAEILYNHVFFSDLPAEYRLELMRDDFFLKVVDHDKFNPRLIEWLSTYRRVRDTPAARYRTFVERLLENPAEIWRHAYERQISDAGRSLLLALHSLGGRASEDWIETAFRSLHQRRADRYGFTRHPDDFSAAIAELNGAFIRPAPSSGVEFINPSVVDWLNSLLLSGSDDSVDVVLGSPSFAQFGNVWRLAATKVGRDMRRSMAAAGSPLAHHVGELAVRFREWGANDDLNRSGPPAERRLKIVLETAQALRSPGWHEVAGRVAAGVAERWSEHYAEVSDGVDLIAAIDACTWAKKGLPPGFRETCIDALLRSANAGCGSEDLVSLGQLCETERVAGASARETLEDGLTVYRDDWFSDELHNCQSNQDFADLRDRLLTLRVLFGNDLEGELARVDEREAELDEREQMRADEAYERYREREAEARFADGEIRAMFGSLMSDD